MDEVAEGNERGEDGAAEIGPEHHPLPVAAIGHRPSDRAHQEVGSGLERTDDPHHEPRAREREDEKRHCRRAHRVAGGRDRLTDQKGPEVAIPAQRLIGEGLRAGRHAGKATAGSASWTGLACPA